MTHELDSLQILLFAYNRRFQQDQQELQMYRDLCGGKLDKIIINLEEDSLNMIEKDSILREAIKKELKLKPEKNE